VGKKWFETVLEDPGIQLLIPNPLHNSFWQETDCNHIWYMRNDKCSEFPGDYTINFTKGRSM
jgi:general stress protein 26